LPQITDISDSTAVRYVRYAGTVVGSAISLVAGDVLLIVAAAPPTQATAA
jgi:hypothetical protein